MNRLIELGLVEEMADDSLFLHRLMGRFIQHTQTDTTAITAVCNILGIIIRNERHPNFERRAIAFRLMELDWLTIASATNIDSFIAYLELILPYTDSNTRRSNLVSHINGYLNQASDPRQRTFLHLYCAILHGMLGNLPDAERYYRDALLLMQDRSFTDQRLEARIRLGLGNIMRMRGAQIPISDSARATKLQVAADLYRQALRSAQAYGQDLQLELTISKEYIYNSSLQKRWDRARRIYERASETLHHSSLRTDRIAFTTAHAQLLETLSQMHFERANHLAATNARKKALSEYNTAYQITENEIAELQQVFDATGAPVLIHDLVLAHINAGDYLLGMRQCQPDAPPRQHNEICTHWQRAEELALEYDISDWIDDVQQRLTVNCPG